MKKNKKTEFFLFLFLFLLLAGFFGFGEKVLADNQLIISEIMYDLDGSDSKREWLELYNPKDSRISVAKGDLGMIDESENRDETGKLKNTCHAFGQGLEINPDDFAVIADDSDQFKTDYPDFTGQLLDSALALSNSSGYIKISFDRCKTWSGEASYKSDYGANGSGNSLEKKSLTEADDRENWQESYVLGGTPGEKSSKKPEAKIYSDKIYINEFLPAPSSGKEEYIELYNPTGEITDLSGWKLADASASGKYIFPEGTFIESSAFLVFYKSDFKFALNNSGKESVKLFDPDGKLVSSVSYSGSKTDVSYNFDGVNWKQSRFLTLGQTNKFNSPPKVKSEKAKKIYVNMFAEFSAKGSDADQDKLKFIWDFGDGHKSYLQKTRHKYEKSGKYTITLKVSDGSEDVFQEFKIEVKKFPKSKITIVSISPNPKGKDSDLEYITLKNETKKKIDLKDWIIATGSKNLYNHKINGRLIIKPGQTIQVTRKISSFSLNNKKAKVELRYPDGKVASKLAYDKKKEGVAEDEIYTKESGEWAWVAPKTETVLALENKPLETTPSMAIESEVLEEPGIVLASDQNFSEDPNFRKTALTNFNQLQGVVLGAETYRPSFSETRFSNPKIYLLESLFLRLNYSVNYFLNKLFVFFD